MPAQQRGLATSPGDERLLALATDLGNAYQLMRAKTALGVVVAATDASRGCSLLDEALELAHRADPPYWTGSTSAFAAAVRPDPHDAIRSLTASLDE